MQWFMIYKIAFYHINKRYWIVEKGGKSNIAVFFKSYKNMIWQHRLENYGKMDFGTSLEMGQGACPSVPLKSGTRSLSLCPGS